MRMSLPMIDAAARPGWRWPDWLDRWSLFAVALALLIALPVLVVFASVLVPTRGVWSHLAATVLSGYVGLVPEEDVLPALREQAGIMRALAARVPADKETWAYGPDKWTVRQVIGHLNDAERVFSYRALCFSRAEQNHLPAFDENTYVANAAFNDVPLADLAEEFALLRSANVKLFEGLRVSDSFLLQTHLREILFRKPAYLSGSTPGA